MYLLYSLALGIGLVVLSPWFLIQGLRRGKYLPSLRGRLGAVPEGIAQAARQSKGHGGIWVHAVSVGEAMAAVPLVRGLRERFPERPVYVSTTTETGQATARERLGKWAAGVFYFPLDLSWIVRRTIGRVRPSLIVILETEIWPNFLREAARGGIPVLFVNARISARSLPRYERVDRLFGKFLRKVLREPVLFLAQSNEDAARLIKMGAPVGKVIVMGNMKYDVAAPAENSLSLWLKQQGGKGRGRPVVVAGSVMAGEESAVLEAFDEVRKDWPRALLVLAPRKPERFDGAAELAGADGRMLVRRSQLQTAEEFESGTDVILLDSIGELAPVYGAADAVFVGGSLVVTGGHNILEPAACGKAPAFGPHMGNFSEMADKFVEARGGQRVINGAELGQFWRRLLADDELREAMGRAAASILEANRGATEKTLEAIGVLMAQRAERK
jgi:3-deoxy-D-manno-octulosonic-acid transferase